MSRPRRSSVRARTQRGAALMMLMVIVVLGATWYLVSALNSASSNADLARRQLSSRALAEAKQALLGYAAAQAATDANPGRLPCPEAAGYATNADPDDDGVAQGGICTLPAVGRLPWRTLGLAKLTDGYGEPLWYVVSPGFASSAGLSINSNTPAQLTVDGTNAAAVALIIAPGTAMNVQAASGCTARVQQRNFPTTFDLRDYLECENASTEVAPGPYNFATTGASTSFNDQVVKITHAELFNVVEPVVAKRIEIDIVPLFKLTNSGVYNTPDWNATATTPRFPFAAPFANPDTSSYTGAAATYQGLLPLSYSKQTDGVTDCVVGASDPRCNPSLVTWKTGAGLSNTVPSINNARRLSVSCTPSASPPCAPPAGYAAATISVPAASPYISVTEVWNSNSNDRSTLVQLDCSATTPTQISCAITYGRSSGTQTVRPRVRLTVRALNVAKAFKAFEANTAPPLLANTFKTGTIYGASPLGVLRSDGDADITTEWLLPSKSCNVLQCFTYTITIPIALIVDHAVANSATSEMGWFLSNEWHKVTYYAVSSGNAPGGAGTCVAGGTPACLTVNSPSGNTSPNTLLILTGRNIGAGTRPSSVLADYLEGANADGTDLVFARQNLSASFNDRLSTIYP